MPTTTSRYSTGDQQTHTSTLVSLAPTSPWGGMWRGDTTTFMQPCLSVDLPPSYCSTNPQLEGLTCSGCSLLWRQLPSLQLHGKLAARAGAGSFLLWPQLCCWAHFFQQLHQLLCHIMSGWSPVLLHKCLLYAGSSLPLFIPPSA